MSCNFCFTINGEKHHDTHLPPTKNVPDGILSDRETRKFHQIFNIPAWQGKQQVIQMCLSFTFSEATTMLRILLFVRLVSNEICIPYGSMGNKLEILQENNSSKLVKSSNLTRISQKQNKLITHQIGTSIITHRRNL